MQKKRLFNVLAMLFVIAGIVLTVIGVMRYRDETRVQQSVLEEYRWDDSGKKQSETVDTTEATENTSTDETESTSNPETNDASDANESVSSDTTETTEQPVENTETAQ